MAPVTTAVSTSYAKIIFVAPANNGASITAYKILIGPTFVENTQYCDGSDATIKANLYCLIPMTVFSSTYGLSQGTLITAKV
jgi:hypothetical protein